MQRKASSKTRLTNAMERRFHEWTAAQTCIVCGRNTPPSIVHHCWGATWKVKVGLTTVLIGHWAVLPLCGQHDAIVTQRSRRVFEELTGQKQAEWLLGHMYAYPWIIEIPADVIEGVRLMRK